MQFQNKTSIINARKRELSNIKSSHKPSMAHCYLNHDGVKQIHKLHDQYDHPSEKAPQLKNDTCLGTGEVVVTGVFWLLHN